MFTWKDYCPLTGKEAMHAFEGGLMVLGLGPKNSFVVRSKHDIQRHASRGGIFATNREMLARKETFYIANYAVYRHNEEGVVTVSKRFNTRDEAMDNCHSLLTKTMLEHGICEDGDYMATFQLDRFTFDNYAGVDDCDEGEITMKDGAVTRVPSGFWLPF